MDSTNEPPTLDFRSISPPLHRAYKEFIDVMFSNVDIKNEKEALDTNVFCEETKAEVSNKDSKIENIVNELVSKEEVSIGDVFKQKVSTDEISEKDVSKEKVFDEVSVNNVPNTDVNEVSNEIPNSIDNEKEDPMHEYIIFESMISPTEFKEENKSPATSPLKNTDTVPNPDPFIEDPAINDIAIEETTTDDAENDGLISYKKKIGYNKGNILQPSLSIPKPSASPVATRKSGLLSKPKLMDFSPAHIPPKRSAEVVKRKIPQLRDRKNNEDGW